MSDTPEWSSPDQRPEHERNQAPPPQQPPPAPGYGQYQQQPIKPGIIPLRPLGVGEILDGAISTMRQYPKQVLGAAAVVVAITQVLSFFVTWAVLDDLNAAATLNPDTMTPEELNSRALDILAGTLSSAGVTLVITLVAQVFLSGYVTVVVGRAVLGQQITFGEAWQEFKPRLLPLLGATLLYGLIIMVGFVLCIIPGVWLGVMFSLVTPALVLERAPVTEALRRSRALVNGAWWRTFGILLLAGILGGIVASIIQLPFGLAGTDFGAVMAGQPATTSVGALLLAALGATIAGTITYPFSSAVTVLVYVDRRIRREGMDIELARAAGLNGGQ